VSDILAVHYHRPPDRFDIFEQQLVHADEHVVVSLLESASKQEPALINGKLALEQGSPIVWFIFPGAQHDIGRFHSRTGEFTGYYSDIIEPAEIKSSNQVILTDLFLDVWVDRDGQASIVDADELDAAVEKGWISQTVADGAWAEANRLIALHEQGAWPPAVVNEWTLDRVRQKLRSSTTNRENQ
jgi:predicted RNA-binding protein associated with RNAse of E/G family